MQLSYHPWNAQVSLFILHPYIANLNHYQSLTQQESLSHVEKDHNYHKTSNISRTLLCNKIVDHADVVGASPVGAAPTTSSYLT